MKYPVGTTIKSKSSPALKGRIIGHDGNQNIIEWSEHSSSRSPWKNMWGDADIDIDHDKTVTLPTFADEDLFRV